MQGVVDDKLNKGAMDMAKAESYYYIVYNEFKNLEDGFVITSRIEENETKNTVVELKKIINRKIKDSHRDLRLKVINETELNLKNKIYNRMLNFCQTRLDFYKNMYNDIY